MTAALYAIVLDCADAARLADFWAAVLRREVDTDATAEFASIGLAGEAPARPHWMFIKVAESKQAKNRVHVDLISHARDHEVDRILALGARHLADLDEGGVQWTTLADPEGNEFDVVQDADG